jgi:hypothetical protein
MDTLDRPGILMELSALFANRGVSVQAITAKGSQVLGQHLGKLLLTFEASPQKQALLVRVLKRHPALCNVQVVPFDDPAVRMLATLHTALPIAEVWANQTLPAEVQAVPLATSAVVLVGVPAAVVALLETLEQAGLVKDFFYTVTLL